MKRTVTFTTLFLLLVSVSELAADQHHKNWFKLLKGEWTYEWKSEDGGFDEKGEISYTLAAGGNVLVGRVTTENGDQELETRGWEPDTRTLVLKGFSSNGGHWSIEYTDVGAEAMAGKTRGRRPSGETWEGTATLKKNENGLVVRIEATTAGKPSVSIGKMRRKKFEVLEAKVPEEALKHMGFLAGKWEATVYVNGEMIGTSSSERNWVPSDYCLSTEFQAEEGGVRRSATGVCGWNPKTREIVEHWFYAEGSYLTARYPLEKLGEQSWTGTCSFVDASGKETAARVRLLKVENGFDWTARWEEEGRRMVRKAVTRRAN